MRPNGPVWESWVDRQIREAQARGEFDDLPGAGKPLPDLDRPRDDLWWVRRKARDEGLAYLPPQLQLRKDVADARGRAAAARSEGDVREIVRAVNERIREANRTGVVAGGVAPLDEDAVVGSWRRGRGAA